MEDKREAGETAAGLRLCWIRASRTCVRVLEKKKKYFKRQLHLLKLVMIYFYIFFSHVHFLNEEVQAQR